MSVIDNLIEANRDYARTVSGGTPGTPTRQVAVLTCMDCRIDPLRALGLDLGQAHVLRNAGGLVTADAIRSLAISQHKLGTTAVMIIQHTQCGLGSFSDQEFCSALEHETGTAPPWSPQPFGDQDQNVRDAVRAARSSPFLPHRDNIRGFIFDVETGLLRAVS